MLSSRIVPCLLIHNGGLVKTVQFRMPKYVGDPINAVRIFNEKEADELIVLDIDATVNATEPNFRLISMLAMECRMPLCYGGGIKTVEQAKKIIGLGVEKIAISSGFFNNPDLISSAARELGSQSVVVVLDVKEGEDNSRYSVCTHNNTQSTGRTVLEAALEAEAAGAGEIVINSIDRDGKMEGYDLKLAQNVRQAIHVPMTILGGAGELSHMREVIDACGVMGVSAGSLFVFKGPYKAVLISYPNRVQKARLMNAASKSI